MWKCQFCSWENDQSLLYCRNPKCGARRPGSMIVEVRRA